MDSELAELLPRERLIQEGVETLSDAELLAILFGTGTKKENVFQIAHRLSAYGASNFSFSGPVEWVAQEWGIPLTKVCQLQACLEIGRRLFHTAGSSSLSLRTPEQVAYYVRDLEPLQKEVFRGLYLNSRRQLIHDEWVSIGSLTMSLVHPREVFQPAIVHSAHSLVIVHNHPSGDPTPSPEDVALTRRLIQVGKLLGIELLDHLIVGKGHFISFQREGMLKVENISSVNN